MEAKEMLRLFRNINEGIGIEIEAIESGKSVATSFFHALEQLPGAVHGEEQIRRLRQAEMEHLLCYRNLMTIKYLCLRGMNLLDKDSAALLYARGVEGKSWPEIAGEFQYSESQLRRRYHNALDLFKNALEMDRTCA